MARKTRKRRSRRRRNAWKGDTAGHRRAAKKGWRRRKRRRNPRRNDWPGQPRRHSKAAKKGWRRRKRRRNPARSYRRRNRSAAPRRSYRRRRNRRNPARSYRRRRYRRNPARRSVALRSSSNPIQAIQDAFKTAFSKDTIETVVHTGVGLGGSLIGTKVIGDLIPDLTRSDVGRIGTSLGVSIVGAGLGAPFLGRQFAARFMVGGMIGTLLQVLGAAIPEGSEARQYIPVVGLGQESEEFKSAIEKEVLKELRAGVGDYIPPAGVEAGYIPAAGASAYLTEQEAERTLYDNGMGAYLTAREAEGATMQPTGMMGMGEDYDPIGAKGASMLPERF